MPKPADRVVGDESVREAFRTWGAAECENVRYRLVEGLELANFGQPEARARVVATAKRVGVEMVDIRNRMGNGEEPVLVIGGRVIGRAEWATSPDNPFPAAHKAVMPWELFPRLMARNNPLKDWTRWMEPDSAPLDVSVHEFLRAQGLSDAAIKLAFDTSPYYGTNSYDVSALMYEANEGWGKVVMSEPGAFAVKGGNERLPQAMARQLKGDVLLGREVIGIDVGADAVTVSCADGSTFRARRAVCTLPFSTLRNVRIHPALEGAQAQAVMTLPYQPLALAFLTVKSPFWEEERRAPSMWTDGRLGVVSAQRFGATPEEVTGLLVWARGNLAHYWDRLGKEAALQMVVREIETIRPAARGKIAGAALHSWTAERFNGGDFSYFAPGQLTSIVGKMADPHGRLHFAAQHLLEVDRVQVLRPVVGRVGVGDVLGQHALRNHRLNVRIDTTHGVLRVRAARLHAAQPAQAAAGNRIPNSVDKVASVAVRVNCQ